MVFIEHKIILSSHLVATWSEVLSFLRWSETAVFTFAQGRADKLPLLKGKS